MSADEIPLVRFLSGSGIGSRRYCDQLIKESRVTVNGECARLGTRIVEGIDKIIVDNIPVEPAPEYIYILLYKPRGYLVSDEDPEGRPLAKTLLPDFRMRLFPVGRLDFQTEGAILYTNDGIWANRIAHPSNRVPKTYLAKVRNIPSPEMLLKWKKGVFDHGKLLKAVSARITETTRKNAWIEITLTGGVNRQVRRMGEATGHPVVKLIRTSIGSIDLGNLEPGQFRYLHPKEIRALLEWEKKTLVTRDKRPVKTTKRLTYSPTYSSSKRG